MPYVFVRENAIKYWCTVQGLNHNEVRILAEKVQDQPEHHDDRAKRVEFSLPTWLVLNALELMGFKVKGSSSVTESQRSLKITEGSERSLKVLKGH